MYAARNKHDQEAHGSGSRSLAARHVVCPRGRLSECARPRLHPVLRKVSKDVPLKVRPETQASVDGKRVTSAKLEPNTSHHQTQVE